MDKINFENLPSTNTPLDADTLNAMQENIEKSVVAVGSTEPSTNEKVWLKKGKNLFNKNLGFTNAYVDENGNIVEDNNNALSNHHIPVIAGQSYTAKANQSVFNMYLNFYDENGNYIFGSGSSSTTQQITVIAPTNAKYALFQFNYNGSTAVTSTIIDSLNIIVVQGTTASAYEPYIINKIVTKNNNGGYEEFYLESDITVEETSYQVVWNNEPYTFNFKKYGKIVTLQVLASNSADLNGIPITTIPERFRSAFELSFAVLGYGVLIGTAWLTTEGKLYLKTSAGNMVRIMITYVTK